MKDERDILMKISELELEASKLTYKDIFVTSTHLVILKTKIEMLKWVLDEI